MAVMAATTIPSVPPNFDSSRFAITNFGHHNLGGSMGNGPNNPRFGFERPHTTLNSSQGSALKSVPRPAHTPTTPLATSLTSPLGATQPDRPPTAPAPYVPDPSVYQPSAPFVPPAHLQLHTPTNSAPSTPQTKIRPSTGTLMSPSGQQHPSTPTRPSTGSLLSPTMQAAAKTPQNARLHTPLTPQNAPLSRLSHVPITIAASPMAVAVTLAAAANHVVRILLV
jgi:hypothetical protein